MSRQELTVENLFEFLQKHRWAVQSSVTQEHEPQAAVVGFALTSKREIIFDTASSSRKARNLRINSNIALVIGWDDAQTVQLEGVVDEPKGPELDRVRSAYFDKFPDGIERAKAEDIAYFCMTIKWARYSDFRETPPLIVAWTGRELQAAP